MAVATAGSHRTARSGPKTNLSTLLMGLVLSRLAAARNRPQAGPGDRPRAATAGAGADRSRRVDETGKSPRPGAKKDALSLKGAEAEQAAATEPDRGRTAETPSQIPAKGWKDILWRVYAQIGEDRVLSVAAGVTFYALLALFPGITAFVSLYGLFADAGTVSDHLAKLSGILPERRARHHRRAGQAHRLEAGRVARLRVLLRPRDRAVELERRHEGALRRAQHRL